MSKYENTDKVIPIAKDNVSISFNKEKCIQCGKCKDVCSEEITVGKMYDLKKTNDNPVCINCGECIRFCPTQAINEKTQYKQLKEIVKNPEKIIVVSIEKDESKLLAEQLKTKITPEKMVAILEKLGVKYVTNLQFGEDMATIEEAAELTKKLKEKPKQLIYFSSWCPAWVKYVEIFYPEFIQNISTVKSPIAIQGRTIKTYFAKKMYIEQKNLVHVVISPCIAKKYEINRAEFEVNGIKDTDYALTTKELVDWIKEENIPIHNLQEKPFTEISNQPNCIETSEKVNKERWQNLLETIYYNIINQDPPKDFTKIKEKTIQLQEQSIEIYNMQEIHQAKQILDEIKQEKNMLNAYMQVKACSNRCYQSKNQLSYLNYDVLNVYSNFYGEPLGEKANQMLHTKYENKSYFLGYNRK